MAGGSGVQKRLHLTHIEMLTIIHLTRQPEGRWKLPVLVKVYYEIIVLFFTREQDGYFLCI